MEASQAGLAGAGDAGQGGAAEAQTADQSQLSDVLEALKGVPGEVAGIKDFLSSQPWQPQQAAEEPQDPFAGLFGPEEPADPEQPEYDPRQFAEALKGALDQQVQQAVGPLQQQLEQHQLQRELDTLAYEVPELQDPEVVKQLEGHINQVATMYPQVEPIRNQPWFLRQQYYAMKGIAAHNAERAGAESQGAAHLEGGSGATPGGSSSMDRAAQITEAARGGTSALPFP